MQEILFSVLLITILCITSMLSMTLLKKHRTMKLVFCVCEDNTHRTEAVAILDELNFMALAIGDHFGAVALYPMSAENVLNKADEKLVAHVFVKYTGAKNTETIQNILAQEPTEVLLFDATGSPDQPKDGEVSLYFSRKPGTAVTGHLLNGTTYNSRWNGVERQIVMVFIRSLVKEGITWDSATEVTASNGAYKYSVILPPNGVPQRIVSKAREGTIVLKQIHATHLLLFVDQSPDASFSRHKKGVTPHGLLSTIRGFFAPKNKEDEQSLL